MLLARGVLCWIAMLLLSVTRSQDAYGHCRIDELPGATQVSAARPCDQKAMLLTNSLLASTYLGGSGQDGHYEVRVTSFPDVRERWQISTAGGSEPAWSHDGRELLYIADDGYLMSATVAPGAEFAVSSQQRLLSTDPYARYGFFNRNYDVRRDGTFLMLRNAGTSTSSLVAVHGSAATLRARAGR